MATTSNAYFLTPGPNQRFTVERINIMLQDDLRIRCNSYYSAGMLPNGITVTLENLENLIHDYTPQKIKTIGHWGLVAGTDMAITTFLGSEDLMLVRWSLFKAGHSTVVDGRNGEFMKFNVMDDLSPLLSHIVLAQGLDEWVGSS